MGATFNGASDYLNDTTNFLDMNAAYTMMGWFRYPSSPTGAPNVIFAITNTAGTQYDLLRHDNNVLATIVSGTTTTGSTLSANTWYHVALVRSGTGNLDVYLDGNPTADISDTTSVSGRASANQESVGGILATYDMNGDLGGVKEWSTNLTAAEIAREMYSFRALKRTNLFRETLILPGDRTKDISGNGYDWTENGTITDAQNPPISWSGGRIKNPYEAATAGITGSGAIAANAASTTASGVSSNFGSGALASAAATLSGSGLSSNTGSGAIAATTATLSGTGVEGITGSGALQAATAIIIGSDSEATGETYFSARLLDKLTANLNSRLLQ
jgi:hypothetical protein